MAGKELRRLAPALLVGAAVAFPAGLHFARREPPLPGQEAAPDVVGTRNFYAPGFADDPFVLDRQRRTVQALEPQCRRLGEHCAEARSARRWLSEAGKGR